MNDVELYIYEKNKYKVCSFNNDKFENCKIEIPEDLNYNLDTWKDIMLQIYAYKYSEAEYIGFCVYDKMLNCQKEYMESPNGKDLNYKKCDITLPALMSVDSEFKCKNIYKYLKKFDQNHNSDYFNSFLELLFAYVPDQKNLINKLLCESRIIPYNTFIMKRTVFLDFMNWCLPLLEKCEIKLDLDMVSQEQLKQLSIFESILLQIYCRINKNLDIQYSDLNCVKDKPTQLCPAFAENNIAVVLASSDYYTVYLSVVLQSILDNSSETFNYDIVVLERDITKSNKQIISNMFIDKSNFSLRFYNVNNEFENIKFEAGGHISIETFYRLCIPSVFNNYDKILYLDCDLTVHVDIAQLFNMNINNYMVAATRDIYVASMHNGVDTSFDTYCKNKLNLADVQGYFQAGVMLLNLKRFRKKYTQEEIFDIAMKRHYRYVDQDIMNILCQGEVYYLDLVWNCFPEFGDYEYSFMPNKLKKQYDEARLNPKICHHTGEFKPWFELFRDNMMTEKFWKYARKSPMYEQIVYRMVEYAIDKTLASKRENKRIFRVLIWIENKCIKPLANKIFPRGSYGRRKIALIYFKMKKKPAPPWTLED